MAVPGDLERGLRSAFGTGLASYLISKLDFIDVSTAGTAEASKGLVLGTDKNVDVLAIADGGLKLGSGAGTAVTSTAAELNILDGATLAVAELNILDGATLDVAELNILDGVLATTAELNRAADVSTRVVNVTAATLAVTIALHDSKLVTINAAAGCAITLPAATGSGAMFRFYLGTAVTSNTTTIKVADASDTMSGNALIGQDAADTVVWFEAGATADTITFNGTTTGGLKGDYVELWDVAADLYFVRVVAAATGTEATPFSATV
jgi:hypothetical protein